MKLDREKFLAAALLLSAASAVSGCSKSSDAPAAVKDESAPRPNPIQVQPPSREGVTPPSKEGVAPPAKEGAVPPPAQEGKPGTGSPNKIKPIPHVGVQLALATA